MDNLTVEIIPKRKHAVAVLKGRLDLLSAPEAEKILLPVADVSNAVLIMDLSGLEYLSSAGLRTFLLAAKAARLNHGRVCLTGPRREIAEVLRISGFLSLFETYDSVADAERLLI